ncbi:MAG: TolC family protein [Thermoflavifilum sp.]|nr:TolC family protein [Thermoflavifilum sp.]
MNILSFIYRLARWMAIGAAWLTILAIYAPVGYAQTLDLQQILDSIDQRNASLRQYTYKQQASRNMANAAKAWPAPELGLGLTEFPYPGSGKQESDMARKMPMIRAQQMLPVFGRQRAEAHYYQSLIPVYADEQASLRNQLRMRARTAYVDIWIYEHQLSIVHEQEAQLHLLMDILEKQLAYNKAQPADIYRIREKLADLHNQGISLQSLIVENKAVLNGLMNKPIGEDLRIDTTQWPLAETAVAGKDTTHLLKQRADLRLLTHQQVSLDWQRQMVLAELKPRLTFSWDNMRMAGGMYMYNLMAMIALPAWPWAATSQRQQALSIQAEIQVISQQQQAQLFEAQAEIASLHAHLQSLQQQMQNYRQEILPAYRQTYMTYLQNLSETTGQVFETLQAWEEWAAKQNDYLNLQREYLHTHIALLAAFEQ